MGAATAPLLDGAGGATLEVRAANGEAWTPLPKPAPGGAGAFGGGGGAGGLTAGSLISPVAKGDIIMYSVPAPVRSLASAEEGGCCVSLPITRRPETGGTVSARGGALGVAVAGAPAAGRTVGMSAERPAAGRSGGGFFLGRSRSSRWASIFSSSSLKLSAFSTLMKSPRSAASYQAICASELRTTKAASDC